MLSITVTNSVHGCMVTAGVCASGTCSFTWETTPTRVLEPHAVENNFLVQICFLFVSCFNPFAISGECVCSSPQLLANP